MKLILIASFFFLATAVHAVDNDYKQMCYEICTHKVCAGNNVNTLCAASFVGTYNHVDYRRRSESADAVHASICVTAPYDVRTFVRADYYCQPATALTY
ncbi:hypothetical protein BGZ97_007064 [Linnemannia gamsii]|jgi:hypothetical protein|uniref:Uncharacterized protein n=1 Tax=Linnemannia gamsii TaxID=64522 RepID=A0A9P6QSK4_9FUNG|nr:hypothetical protein BGZ97_007064 [Linnemannia gamsii]